MNIEIQANGIPPSKDVQHFVRCRADLALRALRDQIGLVSVFVSAGEFDDGNDIRCLVLIKLSSHPDVVVESTDANLYIAIHRAVDDAGWTLARNLMRQQNSLMHRQFEMIGGQRPQSKARDLVETDRAA